MPGELLGDHVVVRAQSEANRIHSKGHYGRPLSGGGLRLDLVEATYLAEADRLAVERAGHALGWADLVIEASRCQPGFEILYLVYRDLRERGYLVRAADGPAARAGAPFVSWPRGTLRPGAPEAWMRAVSERSEFVFGELDGFVQAARDAACLARLAVVDEESDLTYYELGADAPAGRAGPGALPATRAVLLADRILVPDPSLARELHAREFLGKPVGSGLQLSLVESLHLVERGVLAVQDARTGKPLAAAALRRRGREIEPHLELRARIYAELRRRGLFVKTGFKFGTHFRAYEGDPDAGHAPYLVQAVPADFRTPWEPVARAIRLSHSVRKKFYFAAPERGRVRFLSFGRFRP